MADEGGDRAGVDGRAIGAALVLVVLLALVVVPGILGRRIAGAAQAVPILRVPPIGACLDYRPGPTPSATQVPCESAHTAELVAGAQSWSAQHVFCGQIYDRTYTIDVTRWQQVEPLLVEVTVQIGGQQGWRGCLRMPSEPGATPGTRPYVGVVFDPTAPTPVTPRQWANSLSRCFVDESAESPMIPCTKPHAVERIAVKIADGDQPDRPCAELAVDAVGSAAPFAGAHPLRSRQSLSDVGWPADDPSAGSVVITQTRANGSIVSSRLPWLRCDVLAAPGRLLTAPVVGLGAGPIPYR